MLASELRYIPEAKGMFKDVKTGSVFTIIKQSGNHVFLKMEEELGQNAEDLNTGVKVFCGNDTPVVVLRTELVLWDQDEPK